MPGIRVGLCVMALGLALPVEAQKPELKPAHRDSIPERYREYTAVRPFGALHLGGVGRLAVGIGVMPFASVGLHGFAGIGVIGEVGLGSLQASLAAAGVSSYGGVRLQVTGLRSWGEPAIVERGQWFVGVELQMTLLAFGPRAGFFKRVAGDAVGDASFVAGGLVIGF